MDLINKKFLITGGFGLLGSHIAEQLLTAGARQVVLFDNGSVGSRETVRHLLDDPRIVVIGGDILRQNELYDALEDVSGVFHTAYFITLPLSKNLWTGMDVNIRGIMNLLEACRIRGVQKIIYSSSISTYGNTSVGVITEDCPFSSHGVHPAPALYGSGKVMSEHLCAFFKQRYGLDYVAVRVSSVYGERQHGRGINVLPIMQAYDRINQGLPPLVNAEADEVHDYVYAGDVAAAQLLAMQSGVSGEAINVAAGESTTYETLIRTVLEVCGSDLEPEFRQEAGRIKSAGVTANRFSIDKAAALLNWRPTVTLKQGIQRLIEWEVKAASAGGNKV
ncbi:NAD(P)-dependent oxidoreductase [Herbaspirillum sp. RV1423]|uniref:NAD-dependent epimerase/dehydratase family protein n=1 Tax=Herbaspirillum sp. RV1423 TaxID=1443993 RepID=UPI0004B7D0B1|nr:NAD-dependent epimerase/dehydratase family protein [Herbaspirillum sp. RV1423]